MAAEMKVQLPVGFNRRPITMADIPSLVELFNIFGQAHFGQITDDVDDVNAYYQMPGFHVETDTLLILDQTGKFVGFLEFWDTVELHIRYNTWGIVHPEYEGLGIGSYLLAWAESRAQKSLPLAPEGARVALLNGIDSRLTAAAKLLERSGYHHIRSHYHMHIDLEDNLPQAEVPSGFIIRPFQGEIERRGLIYAFYESFHDHWGFQPESFESYEKRWQMNAQLPKMDPSMWYVGIKDGEVVGGCACMQSLPEDSQMGWVATLGVRRPWRKHGLGLAFLRMAFQEFKRRGKQRVGLGVDASNLTGALRLYEQAGMHPARQYNTFEKVLRDGVELSTEKLEIS